MPTDLPIHPALVHLPLGIAFVVPLLAVGLLVATWRGWLPRRALWILAGLQAIVLATALLAQRTGEEAEEMVEDAVPESAIHAHEEDAEAFTAGAGLLLVLFIAGAALPSRKLSLGVTTAAVVVSLGVAGLGAETGHEGGKLVYQHGAAEAWNRATGGGATAAGAAPGAVRARGEDADDDDDDDDEDSDD
ncbi:MAG: hypothetical protein D6798_19420 [Deltaproteobacteria bacterium]|nr:MAG: hypothetical protein D6798_19420 [Deltaproteobacteria bacterium]